MTSTIPKYSTARGIRERIAPIAARKLRSWAEQGLVRVAKMGGNKQSPALYLVRDVIAVMEAYAAGRRPTRGRRR
ncbi:MAG: hypothetical protein HN380_22635 [Victivallales bacterium]|nr:hypothetical protein [Victivallales bacterium]